MDIGQAARMYQEKMNAVKQRIEAVVDDIDENGLNEENLQELRESLLKEHEMTNDKKSWF